MRPTMLLAVLLLAFGRPALAAPPEADVEQLLGLDLYELATVRVVASSKAEEAWFVTPSAVSIITRDRIDQSGAETLGDLLVRLPGVGVFQLSRNRLAVGIRNDGRLFFNSLLLLVDGQPLYHPVIEGPWWEGIPVALQDIERIEVIRGTGSSAWGANSSSGVVNIVTRAPEALTRAKLQVVAGTEDNQETYAAAGGGSDVPWRASLAARRHDSGPDHYETAQISTQLQAQLGSFDTRFSARGYMFTAPDGSISPTVSGETHSRSVSGFIDARRRRDSGETRLFAAVNHADEYLVPTDNDFRLYSSLLELSHQDQLGTAHRYQVSLASQDSWAISNESGQLTTYHPDATSQHSQTAAGTLFLNPADQWLSQLGLRAENHSILDKVLWSPSLHVGWQARGQLFLWGAYDRGYQLPNLVHRSAEIALGQAAIAPGVVVPVVSLPGGSGLPAQPVTQYQLGARLLLNVHLFEMAVFEQRRERQVSIDPTTRRFNPLTRRVEFNRRPFLDSRINGAELVWEGRYRNLDTHANYTWLDKHSHLSLAGNYPRLNPQYSFQHKVNLGLTWHPRPQWAANASLTWYDDYMSEGILFVPNPRINSHTRLDVALSHRFTPEWRWFVAAKNLFNDDIEWNYPFGKNPPEEIEPSVRLGVEYSPGT